MKSTILIVDDEQLIRELLYDFLSKSYNVILCGNGYDALMEIEKNSIQLALVDINMPDMNGLDFIQKAIKIKTDISYIVISGNSHIDSAIDALHCGVWDFIRKPFHDLNSIRKTIDQALSHQELLNENFKYKQDLEQMVLERTRDLESRTLELEESRSSIIGILSRAAEYKDYETGQHFVRVALYSELIAKGLNLTEAEINVIKEAAPVHDIGKIGIPERILLKQGRLTDEEYDEMKNHCLYGEQILSSRTSLFKPQRSDVPFSEEKIFSHTLLDVAAKIAKSHHERFDGQGYPSGLKGCEIPLEARIVAVADVYDALGTNRTYKNAWTEEKCREYLHTNSGSQFDPDVVKAFFSNIDKIMDVKKSYVDQVFTGSSYLNREITYTVL